MFFISDTRFEAWMHHLGGKMSALQETVDGIVTQLGKAKGEIVGAITDLERQVAEGQDLDLTALKAAAQGLDDVVPDAVEPPVDEGQAEEPADEPTE